MTLAVVITTIQRPTPSVIQLARRMAGLDSMLFVAGDTKGPFEYDLSKDADLAPERVRLLTIDHQKSSNFGLGSLLPTRHYCRKNLGYLHAMQSGATCVYETDDDNAPNATWGPRTEFVLAPRLLSGTADVDPQWVNVYAKFTSEPIWPRGLPLDRVRVPVKSSPWTDGDRCQLSAYRNEGIDCPIQQGLVNGSPDVDAIWRLTQDREFVFQNAESVVIIPGHWCPFNTQTTWWWPAAYPLLYVPSNCSFRMCDIWKSFVAQRCIWELGAGVAFHAPEAIQDRNVHNLMRDFEDEIPGYLQNHRIAQILQDLQLRPGAGNVADNLRDCYRALVHHGIFPNQELDLVNCWLADVAAALGGTKPR